MLPIFKNAEIGWADIGKHMCEFAEEADLLRHPRRSLIGSFHASRQLFITPLLKWYMNHGLEVTRVYQVRITCISYAGTLCTFFIRYILYWQVVEYTPNRCFETFGTLVSDARREGDVDPSKVVVSESMKLLGNSGKCLLSIFFYFAFRIVS